MKICYFGESLKTNLQYTYNKSQRILHLYNGQEAVLAGALHAMDLTKIK
jgi:hypothetical protein